MDQPLDMAGAELPSAARRSISTAVWVLLVLAIAVGALLLFRARETGSTPVEPAPAPTPIAAEAPGSVPTVATEATAPAPVAVAPLPPTRPPATPSPVPPTPSPRPRPTLTAPPTALPTALPTARSIQSPGPPVPARPGAVRSREDWLALAERDRVLARQQPGARFTIQLELVCELPSLAEAWRLDREGQMWLASADHHGRPCFRVFWGRYSDLQAASRAKSSVPRFFFTSTNQPTVVSTGPALLP
jgi:hypothetical protein